MCVRTTREERTAPIDSPASPPKNESPTHDLRFCLSALCCCCWVPHSHHHHPRRKKATKTPSQFTSLNPPPHPLSLSPSRRRTQHHTSPSEQRSRRRRRRSRHGKGNLLALPSPLPLIASRYSPSQLQKKKRTGGGEQPKPASDVAEDKPAEDTSPDVQQPHLNAATTTAAPGTDDKDASTKADDPKKDAKEKEKKPAALPVVTAVLNVDMHCDGCAKRIRASIRHYPGELSLHPSSSASTPSLLILLCSISVDRTGVEGVAMEVDKGTMTVVGRFDAKKLRDRVANKTKKKVDLLPNNKKAGDDNDNKNNKANECDGKPADKKQQQQEDDGDEAGKEDKKKKKEKEEQDDQKKKKAKDNKKPVVVRMILITFPSVHVHRLNSILFDLTELFPVVRVNFVGVCFDLFQRIFCATYSPTSTIFCLACRIPLCRVAGSCVAAF